MVLNRLDDRHKPLVESNLKLVFKMVNSLGIQQSSPNYDDAVQEGCMGLMFAAQNYNADLSKFSTYACICVKGAIQTYLSGNSRRNERLPSVSFSDVVPGTCDVTFEDIIASDETLYDEISAQELYRISVLTIQKMGTEKTRRIVRYYIDRMFMNAAPTYKLLASKFGVSKQWVSSLMGTYRKYLSQALRQEGYDVPMEFGLED